MPLTATAVKNLIEVTRLVATMNLHDELREVARMTGYDPPVVKQYLNGEAPIPTSFRTLLYQKAMKLKQDRQKGIIPEYPFLDIPITIRYENI